MFEKGFFCVVSDLRSDGFVSRACRRQGATLEHDEHPARAEPWSGGSPDPIPNSEVKPRIADGTAASGRGRAGRSARAGCFCIPGEEGM